MPQKTLDELFDSLFDFSEPKKVEFHCTPEQEERARIQLKKLLKKGKKRKFEEKDDTKYENKKIKEICELDFEDKNLSDKISQIKCHQILTTDSCTHEVAIPPDHEYIPLIQMDDKPAKTYPFKLDTFQTQATQCIENNQSVLVSAHTSAGKTVVAEYAIAMCLKNNQRVIYTTPIKALSNQKFRDFNEEFDDVGLMTGDTTINESASCLVMTTEILRAMLYEGADITREVGWVIFDEIHYMRDKERGYVWEESIILLSTSVKAVFLSATIPNARQFAEWICFIRNQPCNVVYTEFRPTPLEHYVFPSNGDIYRIVDKKGNFQETNFSNAFASLQKESETGDIATPKGEVRRNSFFDCMKLVKTIVENKDAPAIIFSFSKKLCEMYAKQASKLDLTKKKDQYSIQEVINNALELVSVKNRNMPCIQSYIPYLKKGIGIHHGGLLPIIKELTELLFGEGLIKVLFATETFAMGLNMPARTVVFTSLQKFDGKNFRWITPGEYIQMSGRAGRRGKDDRGLVIMRVDDTSNTTVVRNLLKGKADPLKSAFHLTYNMVLNNLRFSGMNPEYLLKRSFFQFQNYAKLPGVIKEVKDCHKERRSLKVENVEAVDRYYKLSEKLKELNIERHRHMIRCKQFKEAIIPGSLVKIIHEGVNFGWCIVLADLSKPKKDSTMLPEMYILLKISKDSVVEFDKHAKTTKGEYLNIIRAMRPAKLGSIGVPAAVWIPYTSAWDVSTRHLALPNVNSLQSRQNCLIRVDECIAKHLRDKFVVDPTKRFSLKDEEFLEIVKKMASTTKALHRSPIHGDTKRDELLEKAKLLVENQQKNEELVKKLEDTKGYVQMNELKQSKRVLRRLSFISETDVITTKGNVACELAAANELLLVEMLFDGHFINLTPSECCALLSPFVCNSKAIKPPKLLPKLENALVQLQSSAELIAKEIWFCKLSDDTKTYTEQFQPFLMEVVYWFCEGRSFAHVCKKTTIYAGNIVTAMRRLVVLLRQMVKAAATIGATDMSQKFEEGIKLLNREVVGLESLYL